MDNNCKVWVAAEAKNGKLIHLTLELLGKGRELANRLETDLAAVLLGSQVTALAEELIASGADQIYLLDDPLLAPYQDEVLVRLWDDLIKAHQPEIILFGATGLGVDLAARVAARVNTGLTAHCVDLYLADIGGQTLLVQVVPGWEGNLLVEIICPHQRPQIATVKPGIFTRPEPDPNKQGTIVKLAPHGYQQDCKVEILEVVIDQPAGVPLDTAEVVVAGGWGMKTLGGFAPLEELAHILGGAVAGTRPAVDQGWISEQEMIGISGKTVNPKLFISAGASGAMHFTTGFAKAQIVLAIDQNPAAPIFEVCDLGIVGDLKQVLPVLIQELKTVKQA
jgi:electron transfer flavoprotein alpha subunit